MCDKIKRYWLHLLKWWNGISEIKINIESWDLLECTLFGFHIDHEQIFTLNWIVMNAKAYIYKQRLNNNNNICFVNFLIKLKQKVIIEKEIEMMYGKKQDI